MSAAVKDFLEGLLQEIYFLCTHALLAVVVVFLPWCVSFKVLRFLTRFGLGSSALDPTAVVHIQRFFPQVTTPVALRQIRLHRLVDLADYYKSWVTTRLWLRRYWRVTGEPLPDPQQHPAVLFVTFHYGAGFWALRHFHERGLSMAALYRPPPPARLGEYLNSLFFWLRLSSIKRLSGSQPIRVGDNQSELSALVRRLVRDHKPVGVMPDIPTSQEYAVAATLLGQRVYFASALLRLVVKHKIPVALYTSVTDLQDGGRNMQLHVLYEYDCLETLAQKLASCLEQALTNDPTAWHLWAFVNEILIDK